MFTDPLPGYQDGWLSYFWPLFDQGAIQSLDAETIEGQEGFADFTNTRGDASEAFTPYVAGTARLDAEPVEAFFLGAEGTEVWGQVQLVRTASTRRRALLLHVVGTSGWRLRLPRRTPIVSANVLADSLSAVTKKDARQLLAGAVGTAFHPDGDNPATADSLQILDGGRHTVGRVTYPLGGEKLRHRWYGTAVSEIEGVWSYLFGQLPDS
ncbi:hypothetical protein [Brachybacterium endophyticum]|uniref:hypothetical protein n=1 Tax=Brachybacterium endophyticum TaxID=2182385 RepID=UPI00105786D1|nr:hypothetical protein [Brachybacterium endophyticum]